ncbi:Protein TANC2 [Liparis tanakae]|uniref:Protein TANC2 n=1 Tax=Liparis tanakae TaxID=230148 RepID=A0A4Z2EAA8_9TELE|nr:Protein TANC2 [Liparis tanakae]
MTRLGFLLGEKTPGGGAGPSCHAPQDGQRASSGGGGVHPVVAGCRGSSLSLWPQGGRPAAASGSSSSSGAVAAGSDGFPYRAEDAMAASTYSLNKLHPDWAPGSARSSGSAPLYLMPRPNSVAGKMKKERACV